MQISIILTPFEYALSSLGHKIAGSAVSRDVFRALTPSPAAMAAPVSAPSTPAPAPAAEAVVEDMPDLSC